ncbi:MAG: hypothetical protein ACLSFB_11520 [[Clostridium] scindens]
MDFQKTELTKTIWHQVFTGLIPYGLFLAAQWQVWLLGELVKKIFGFAAGLLFVCAFSRLSIEMSYAAYLRIKDNQYWEEMPEKKVLTREERRVVRTRCIKIINVFFCFGVLYFMGKLVVKYNLTRGQIFIGRIAIILIFLDLGTVMILWIIKKIRKMWKEKKKRRQ